MLKNIISHSRDYIKTLTRQDYTILLCCLLTLFLFKLLKKEIMNYQLDEFGHLYDGLTLLVISIFCIVIKWSDVPKLLKPLIYLPSLMATFYIVAARDPFLSEDLNIYQSTETTLLPIIALISFILGLWRPIFMLVPFILMNWKKALLKDIIGTNVFRTDFEVVSEIGLFFITAFVIFSAIKHLQNKTPTLKEAYHTAIEQKGTKLHFFEYIAFLGIAVHLSNYFYSGWQKIVIAPHPFYWIYENYTQYLYLTAHEMGILPLGFNLELSQYLYNLLDIGFIPLNIAVFIGQLASIFILRNIKATIYLTLFFDIMHVVIFLTTGIFFWKWIILNTAIVIALTSFKNRELSKDFKLILCLTVLLAPQAFWIVRLGWFDTRALNHFYVEAITEDEKLVRVPPAYFWSLSGIMVQNHFMGHIRDRLPIYFDTRTMSTVGRAHKMHPANNCEAFQDQSYLKPEQRIDNYDPKNYFELRILNNDKIYNRVLHTLERHHRFIQGKAPSKLEFYLYPHHFYAWPWCYQEFDNLDLQTIIGYRLNLEAVCLDFKEGQFTRDVKAKDHHDIYIK